MAYCFFCQGPHKRPKEEGPDNPGDEPELNKRQVCYLCIIPGWLNGLATVMNT